jgi:hypothetical protein
MWSGSTPSTDPYLSLYGGVYFALENAAGQYLNDLNQVSFGTVPLHNGGATSAVFYEEFVAGTDTFYASSASLGQVTYGPIAQPIGYYVARRAKFSPVIFSIGPLLSSVPNRLLKFG